jgi:hypothetical protein
MCPCVPGGHLRCGQRLAGAGNAAATIHAQLREAGAQTVVSVSTDLNITGKLAQFGSRMLKEVSAKLLSQFAENVEARLLDPVADDTSASAAAEAAHLGVMAVAGSSIYKRAIPALIAVVAIMALIVYFGVQ